MRQLTIILVLILASSSVATAKHRKPVERPQYPAAATTQQNLWPGRPLCDDGGYRIRPCDIGSTQP
jgi:hypothetical protein